MSPDHGSSSPSERVPVSLGPRSYDVVIGPGLLAAAGRLIAPLLKRPRLVVVTDRTVARHHLPTLAAALDDADIEHRAIVVDPGESTKDFAHLEELTGHLLDAEVERSDCVLALGGGVVGDLAGFAASVLRRGVDIVQAPTTLLAQVDSAVGGKTGINTAHGKNLIGAFHQPRLVIADTGVLDTLPARELTAGYAEIVKYGLLGDRPFFEWLERAGPAVLAGDGAERRHAIAQACRAKAAIVAEDERETGERRALLNLGHTFAHALEAESGYGARLLHGEAVAVGLAMAFDLSVELGFCPATARDRVRHHLAKVGLPTTPAQAGCPGLDRERLIARMRQDKKVKDGHLTFVLVRDIGRAFVERAVSPTALGRVLDRATAA
jgi:3-dehydroquinate synthase